jgi:hypothetical protein
MRFHLTLKGFGKMPTQDFNYAIHAISAVESPILILEFNYAGIPDTLRIVNDNLDIVSNGKNYARSSFSFNEPSSGDKQNPKASINISYSPDLQRLIKQAHGAYGSTITIKQIMRTSPDLIEASWDFDVGAITITSNSISFELSFNNLLEQSSVPFQYRPDTSEGLFI